MPIERGLLFFLQREQKLSVACIGVECSSALTKKQFVVNCGTSPARKGTCFVQLQGTVLFMQAAI